MDQWIADIGDIDAMSLHSSDSEEAGIALGNAPEPARGVPRRHFCACQCIPLQAEGFWAASMLAGMMK